MRIVVFTGAGVSRESGLQTFRDAKEGLWEGYRIEDVASIQGWWNDPARVLTFYNGLRRQVLDAEPNDAHVALAELEQAHDVTIITQNIDDLHERAGSTDVIHLHGEILKVRPVDDEEKLIPWTADLHLGDMDPETGAQLRPHTVWFGEGLPEIRRALEVACAPDVDVLIVVGTTLQVYPAAMIATETKAECVYYVDPRPATLSVPNLTTIHSPATLGVRQVVSELM